MVIIAVMLAALIGLVAILVVFRKRTKSGSGISALYNSDGIDSLKELDNPIYSTGKQPCTCFSKSVKDKNKQLLYCITKMTINHANSSTNNQH